MSKAKVLEKLAQAGIQPKKTLGQNFCCDPQLIAAMVRDAEIQDGELLVEVGPGTGALTRGLLATGHSVMAIEIDSKLYRLNLKLKDEHPERFELIHGDVLANKNRLNPDFVEALKAQLAKPGITGWRLVANLPYNVATSLILLCLELEPAPKGACVLVQKEAAERFLARPVDKQRKRQQDSKLYGAVAVQAAFKVSAEMLRTIPRDVFYPQPKIQSAVLRLRPIEQPMTGEAYAFTKRCVRELFNFRRKTLNKAVKLASKSFPEVAELQAGISACHLDGSLRLEDLTPETLRAVIEHTLNSRGTPHNPS